MTFLNEEKERVKEYLMDEDEGCGLDEETTRSLMATHSLVIQQGLEIGSEVDTIGDSIMDAEAANKEYK